MDPGFMTPKEILEKFRDISYEKTRLSVYKILLLGFLAGAYIAFGAQLATMVTHDASGFLGIGFSKFLFGSVFSVGLMLVLIGGAELFTGNNLVIVGVFTGKATWFGLFRNWFWVYIANFIGSIVLVYFMFYSGLWKVNNFSVGIFALKIGISKVNLSWIEAFTRGVLCNWLVCLACWMAISAKDVVGKIFAIYFPIMAFVASGFEHSVANMYFIPMAIILKGQSILTSVSKISSDALSTLTWSNFITHNLIPVTLGNIVGGVFFVGMIHVLVYYNAEDNLRKGV